MRILYDHQVFSLQDAGGASRYHYQLVRYLDRISDVRTELYLGMHGAVLPLERLASDTTRVITAGRRMRPGMQRYLMNELIGNTLVPFLGKFHVYHPTLYRRMPLVRAHRVVVTHHDCAHERFPHLFPDTRRILAAKAQLFQEADAIICVSEASRDDLLQYYNINAVKTRVIHHGLSALPRCSSEASKLHSLMPGEFLLFAGSRSAYKNFAQFLVAYRKSGLHHSFRLLVVGGGCLMAQEISLIDRLDLRDRIAILPRVTDTLLAEAYARAKLFVYPSLCEGFGFPPLEAMAAGCPVLVSHTSCLPEICRDAPFYFAPLQKGARPISSFYKTGPLEEVLMTAVSDEAARLQKIARGLQVAATYNWQQCGEQTLALYRECQ